MFIAVDGYNFIKQSAGLRKMEQIELQKAREGLIERLAQYKRLKGHSIMVVFDGAQEGKGAGRRERSRGIEIFFSRPGEKADDVLKGLAEEKKREITIVSSDRAVAHFAEKKGASVLSVADFEEKMDMARFYQRKGKEEEPMPDRPVAPSKKGPSHRLSKSERKRLAAARKL